MSREYNEQNEYPEAPEEDEFDNFDATENDAPESIRELIGGPVLVFPDLVRIPTICGTSNISDILSQRATQIQAIDSSRASSGRNNYSSRNSQHRLLDPPDVSMLPSSSSLSTSQPNTLDLCNTIRPNSKRIFINGISNSNSVSSPNSTSSSSSVSSNSTNSSGLVLSNSSSSQSNLKIIDVDVNSTNDIENIDQYQPVPSTSSSYNSPSTLVSNQNVEHELETNIQKTLLKQQLVQKDAQIEELQTALFKLQVTNSTSNLEEIVIKRIDNSLERLNSNLEGTLSALERRISHLENRLKFSNGIEMKGKPYPGDVNNESASLESQLTQTYIDIQKKFGEQQRHEMCTLFRNILTSAVKEIDKFVDTQSSFVTPDFSFVLNRKNSNTKPPNLNGH